MAFQKKGDVKAKKQTPSKLKSKKVDSDDDNMDFDDIDSGSGDEDSSSEEQIVQKTPSNKTPKGKQVLSDKKVSFHIPGQNTPGKNTPKDNSLVGKKQSTPGKMSLKEFQGMMGKITPNKNGKAKKSDEDDDDEEDDDDDDDDDEDDDDEDLDMMLGGDDDEDDDDDDDDDDDEEEDEDDKTANKQKNAKQLNQSKNVAGKAKTPVKIAERTPAKSAEKTKQTPAKKADKTPVKNSPSPQKSEKKADSAVMKKALKLEAESRRDRDARTLFIGSLPLDTTAVELKALSSDIINVSIPVTPNNKKRKAMFAFLEFANEAKAEENMKILQKKKLRNEPLTIDFSGEKSKNRQKAAADSEKNFNLKRLYVASIPIDTTIDQIAKFFPKSFQITLNTNPSNRSAVINYSTEEDAAAELESAKNAKISGRPITVLYSIITESKKKRKRKSKQQNQGKPKKMKMEAKEESDDDDDDDDEEDDDE